MKNKLGQMRFEKDFGNTFKKRKNDNLEMWNDGSSAESFSQEGNPEKAAYRNCIHTERNGGKYIISYDFSALENEADGEKGELIRIQMLNACLQEIEFSEVDLGESDEFALVERINYDGNENEDTVFNAVKVVSGELICTPASVDDSFRFQLDCFVAPGFLEHEEIYTEWCDQHPDMQCRVFQTSIISDSKVCRVLFHEKTNVNIERNLAEAYKDCVNRTYTDGKYVISYSFPDFEDAEDDERDERLRIQAINHFLWQFKFSSVEFGDDDEFALVTRTTSDRSNNVQSVSKSVKLMSGELICIPSNKEDHERFYLTCSVSPDSLDHKRLYTDWCEKNPDLQSRVFQTSHIGDSNICRVLFHSKLQ